MLKSGIRWLSISALLIMVAGPAHAVVSLEEELKDGKLLTCFVYSMQTIPLLNQLQQQLHKGQPDQDTQQIVKAVGGQPETDCPETPDGKGRQQGKRQPEGQIG